jgi:hypothetical protein
VWDFYSAVAEGDDVHLTFLECSGSLCSTGYNVRYAKYTYVSDAWGAETTLQATATSTSAPVISIDADSGNLYVFWGAYPTADHIYYRKWNGASWETSVDWVNEAGNYLSQASLTSFYKAWGNKIGLAYQTSSYLRFEYLDLCPPPTAGEWIISSGAECVCNNTWSVPASLGVYGNLTMQSACNIKFANSTTKSANSSTSGVASTVGTSTASAATNYPYQPKSFYANERFWVFYSDGTNMVYNTSTDGTTWTAATTVRASNNGYRFSIWFDGTYVHYAHSSASAIYYRRGVPGSDGSITWSADEQTVATNYSSADHPYVSVDSNGYVWIGYRDYSGTVYTPFVIKSGNNDGTWGTTPAGFPYQLTTSGGNTRRAAIIPLTDGKMLAVYGGGNIALRAKRWDGSAWGSEKATASTSPNGYSHSEVAQGDDVHLTYLKATSYDILYTKYSYASDAFTADTTVQAATTSTTAPVISRNTITNDLYVFWAGSPTANHIYYKKNVTGTWDASATDWITETALTGNDRLVPFYTMYGKMIGLVYMNGTASPYGIRFNYLNFTQPSQYIYVYPGGRIYMYSGSGMNKPT